MASTSAWVGQYLLPLLEAAAQGTVSPPSGVGGPAATALPLLLLPSESLAATWTRVAALLLLLLLDRLKDNMLL